MRSRRILTVDLGAERVACGIFSRGAAGRLMLERFAFEPLASDVSDETRWQRGLAGGLRALFGSKKKRGAIRLALPGHLTFAKYVRTPSVAPQKRASMLAFEAAENIPSPLNEVAWDGVVLADDGLDAEMVLAAAKLEPLRAFCAAAEAARLEVEAATPAAFALLNGFRYNHPEVHESVLVASVGARSTTLLLLEGERFIFRTFPLGGAALTRAIAQELGVDFARAETLKRDGFDGRADGAREASPHAAIAKATGELVRKLQLEIARSLPHLRAQTKIAAPTALYLCGGGSRVPEIARVGEKLGVPVRVYEPLRNVDLSADARAAGADARAVQLGELVGLAAAGFDGALPRLNLLPRQTIAAAKRQRSQPWWIAAAALVLLALLPPIGRYDRLARLNRDEIARVEERLQPLRTYRQRNTQKLRELESAKAQIAALRPAYRARESWGAFLDDLQTRLQQVEDAWLDRLRVVEKSRDQTTERLMRSAETAEPPLRLELSGRLLDVDNPQSRVSARSVERVQRLLTNLRGSPFIADVENERFESGQNGLLRFDVTLVLASARAF